MFRRSALLLAACTLAATLPAATPEPDSAPAPATTPLPRPMPAPGSASASIPAPESAPGPQLQELDEILIASSVEIRLEDFVEFPKYDRVVVSPDGTKVAMTWIEEIANYARVMGIIEYPSMKPVYSFSLPALYGQADVDWANNDLLMLLPKYPHRSFLRTLEPMGVITISDLKGSNFRYVNQEGTRGGDPIDMLRRDAETLLQVPLDGAADGGKWPGRDALGPVRPIQLRAGGDPNQLMFQTWRNRTRSGNGEGFGAFVLNVDNEKQTRVATLPVNDGQFVPGPDQRIALATGVNEQNQQVVYYLPPDVRAGGREWQLSVSSPAGARGLEPVAWTGNAEEYYALDGRDLPTRAVVIWNATTKARRVVYRHPTADLDQVSLDPAGRAWMFQGHDHFPVYWYPDPEHPLARLHRILAQKVGGEQVDIVSASDDMSVAVTQVSSGRRPPVFMVVDVKAVHSHAGFFAYPTLRGTRLAPVDAIEFRSRDGLVIHGYLTTPEDAGGTPLTGLPLVVIAHDGPLGEPALASYEYERQLFASRGYAVLQVNRRGSPGRGTTFQRAGDGKWGAETQNDFIDAVHWAVRDGVADGERVCFYGTGYGAYSAMVAAAREPDMFKCVVGVAGVYDLPMLLGDGKQDIPLPLAQVLGTDLEQMKARSPVSVAGSIKAQVMLMPQHKDQNFPTEQTNGMRTALLDAKNSPQVQLLGQQMGGMHSTSSRGNGYKQILGFIEKHIGK